MNVLILEKDKLIRDQVKLGLQNFPEFAVDCGEGFGGLNLTKQKDYDCLFVGSDLQDDTGLELIDSFRQTDTNTDLVIVTASKKSKGHQLIRTRYEAFSILYVPIDPREFFRLVARLRRRDAPAM